MCAVVKNVAACCRLHLRLRCPPVVGGGCGCRRADEEQAAVKMLPPPVDGGVAVAVVPAKIKLP